jgi:OOP family OmpA-OmpF porin
VKYMLYLLNSSSIQFAIGLAEISPASSALIGRLAHLAQRCPDAKLEISGYTDNQGQPAVNLRLSKSRADAVAAALTRAGVDAKRLTAAGYGADRPIASNDTDAGRAKNRRIEMHVK